MDRPLLYPSRVYWAKGLFGELLQELKQKMLPNMQFFPAIAQNAKTGYDLTFDESEHGPGNDYPVSEINCLVLFYRSPQ